MMFIRSLVIISLLSMKALAKLAICNNFDGRYPLVKRAQEEPCQLAFDVPCKSSIVTAKLVYSNRPIFVNLKNFHENEKTPVQSKDIPLSKVIKRNDNTRRTISSSSARFRIIKSLHKLNPYFRKYPKFFRQMYKSPKWNKKIKIAWHKLSRNPESERVTRTRYLAHSRRTRSTGVNVLRTRTTTMMHPIAIDTEFVKSVASSPDSETTTLRVKQRSKLTIKPIKLHPKIKAKVIEYGIKLFESFPRAGPTEKVTYNAGLSQRYFTQSQEETTSKELLPLASTGLLSETHNRTNLVPFEQGENNSKVAEHIFPTEATEKYKTNDILYGPSTEVRANHTLEPEEKRITLPLVAKDYIIMKTVPLIQQVYAQALDHFDRLFYNATFKMLSSINPPDRRENGISFVQSGLFLCSFLSALYFEVNSEIQRELKTVLDIDTPVAIQRNINMMRHILYTLPTSEKDLKLSWSTRLVVNGSWTPSTPALDTLRITVEYINAAATPEQLRMILNHKVEEDSGGAMRNTFEEDELSEGVRGVLLNTLYLRARWRSAPTLLNGTQPFRDAPESKPRTTRMIRINDIMSYAALPEWDAEAVEISYSTPGLSLLLLVPRGRSLRNLSALATDFGLNIVYAKMRKLRVAATMPIYTLRMTLLLTNKLQAMGLTRLVDAQAMNAGDLRLSHAVQRIMFWAEAGRNAFKDDGFEWDEAPQLEMLVDRPYLFYVRWRNYTLMNGNFVL